LKYYVGITDYDWYRLLSAQKPDEVNFWRPGSQTSFKAIEVGAPFLFKLHSPRNYIVGGGFFVRYSVLPVSLAWQAFGAKNGATSHEELKERLYKYRDTNETNPSIGCVILTEPFFFDEPDWIPIPDDWKQNIVSGKTYDTETPVGMRLWTEVEARVGVGGAPTVVGEGEAFREKELYGTAYLTRARLGQGTFRVLVTDAYQRRCAITGEKTLVVLEAAHIKPVSRSGPNRIDNGLLLRSDLHTLFDSGYVTVSNDYRVEVSRRIKEEFENGKYYYSLNGNSLSVLPKGDFERPAREFIDWHNQNVYK
jgi:putative restriction endonuclease